MKLSIITINLNNRDGLQKTIDSVISQIFTDYEWIVIDGGSTDGSRELIEQYSDHFAYWCSEPDKGIYNAMNKGIDQAKGEWLQFLNSGDYYYSQNTLLEVFSLSFQSDIVYGDAMYFWNNKTSPNKYPHFLSLYDLATMGINHQASFFRSSIFQNNHYDETYIIYADWALNMKLFFDVYSFQHIDQIIVYFDGMGISSSNSSVMEKEKKRVLEENIPDYLKNDIAIILDYNSLLKKIKEKNSHKTYRLIYSIADWIVKRLEQVIRIIESIRLHFSRK
jgi:glycosyltransferase involved in cell wall biosynthesis